MKNSFAANVAVFFFLIVLGVLGRWLQPEWAVTPAVGVAVFAGYYLSSRLAALLAPVAVMAISNLLLPAYSERGVMVVVYLSLLAPVALGWWLRGRDGYARLAVCAAAPAIVFYLTTNLAVWIFYGSYPHTLAGLGACYAAGLPFLRWMLLGDIFYVTLLFGGYSLAVQAGVLPGAPRSLSPVRIRCED